jgi:DNA-binding IclR family transcriptional regulator
VSDQSGTTVSALDRGIALLDCFSETRRCLGPTDLSRLTGIPRPSVVRLAATLLARRWLQTEPGGERYMLGPGLVSLGRVYLSGLDVRATARPLMQVLADRFGASVHLAVDDGEALVLIEACRARDAMWTTRLDVGSRIPLATSALGRAWLADCEPAERDARLARLSAGHDPVTWPAVAEGVRAAMAQHARDGWCLSLGEFHRDINSAGVALRGPRDERMVLNCGGPVFLIPPQWLQGEVAPALRQEARRLAEAIGGRLAGTTPSPGVAA